jgi:hypothetical protein
LSIETPFFTTHHKKPLAHHAEGLFAFMGVFWRMFTPGRTELLT